MANHDDVPVLIALRVAQKRAECLTDAHRDVEAALAERDAGPKLPFVIDAFLVMGVFIWKAYRQFLVRYAVEQSELLFA